MKEDINDHAVPSSSSDYGQSPSRTASASTSTEHLPPISALFPPLDLPPADPEDYQAPYTDQSCFSWCVQSNHRRNAEYLPTCRMICFNVDRKAMGDDDARRDLLLGRKKSNKGKERAEDVDEAYSMTARRRIRQWIAERELVLFRGDLEGMQEVQTANRHIAYNDTLRGQSQTNRLPPEDIEHVETATSKQQKQRPPIKRKFDDDEWSIERRKIGDGRAVIIPFRDILLTPYHATVARFDRLLQPTYRLITAYFSSFTNGTQERFMKMAWKSVINGDSIETGHKLVGKVQEGWQKRWAEAERRLEAREKEKERLREEAARRGKDI
ncbi:hypothetical protein QFC21_000568 [Naganishia friedmannii]|uniref:Uncharacterized protein n=1 Tax=Naganishia friedmannii TaxID=89922 RepID=A0ACC2WBZ1_9TREE|nr:hypothetical protein QFC21_000568 [Naganishia friedmannii]